jgi:hypothetical protein
MRSAPSPPLSRLAPALPLMVVPEPAAGEVLDPGQGVDADDGCLDRAVRQVGRDADGRSRRAAPTPA